MQHPVLSTLPVFNDQSSSLTDPSATLSSQVESMSLAEQIGQLVMVGFPGTVITPRIEDLIRNHHVGGIILFTRNIQDPEQIFHLTQRLQAIAREAGQRYPLLIAVDQENGMVRRLGKGTTHFPGNMALGAIGSEQVVYDIAQATGRELRSLGINMNLAPVADVNNNPANPVIGIRSFGEDPDDVARLTAAMVMGYRASGVITTLKHFPGHGDTATDSHLALPTIPYGRERLEQIEIRPFRRGMAVGADSIMTAHLALPALMNGLDSNGPVLPSSISPEIVQHLLREQLGFSGVIMTDCLEMSAIIDTVGTVRGAQMALKAGNDLLLISHGYQVQKDSLQALQQAVVREDISLQHVQQSVERILELKARLQAWNDKVDAFPLEIVGSSEHTQLAQQTYEQAITVIRNNLDLLPLRLQADQRLQVFFLQPDSYTYAVEHFAPEATFLEDLRRYHPHVYGQIIPAQATSETYDAMQEAVQQADIVLVVTINAHLDSHQAEVLHSLYQTRRPLIGLAAYNPYDLLACPEIATYMATYEYTPPALQAAAKVLFGALPARGTLPVSIPGLYTLAKKENS